jgi:hypothetical protein
MEQIVIAYKKIREAARLLAAANERALADEAKALAEQVDRRTHTYYP